MQKKSTNVQWQQTKVKKQDRERILNQKGTVIWFTGLSGSGKTTIAKELEKQLNQQNKLTYLLDGDNIRHGINQDLNFTEEDRKENLRRIKEIVNLFQDAGIITIATFISPYEKERQQTRQKLNNNYIEIYTKCSIETCEKRDVKGLYKKARQGQIKNFTGIDSPYEPPTNPEITIDTEKQTLEQSVQTIIDYLKDNEYI